MMRRTTLVLLASLFATDAFAQSRGVFREAWTNLSMGGGVTLNSLTNPVFNPGWPNIPAAGMTLVLSNFEAQASTGMTNYGQRLRAFIVPATNGPHRFWIASDDASLLAVSKDEEPSNAVRVAWVNTACTNRQWNKETNQQSGVIQLEGRRRYYIEAQMIQGATNDNLCVRWALPNGNFEEPLSTTSAVRTLLLQFSGVVTNPVFVWQPSNQTTVAGLGAVFSVLASNASAMSYQWLQNGTNLPGANKSVLAFPKVPHAMSGTTFRCIMSNAIGVATSGVATLSVQAAPAFGFYREMWLYLTNGNSLNGLTNPVNNVNWPTNPAMQFTRYFTNFETEVSSTVSNYGQRVRGFVVPPTNGFFTFWVASDDLSRLLLSSDENPSNAVQIASVPGSTGSRVWTTFTNQQSGPVFLEKGRRYYLEGQMQQGAGGDNFSARWQFLNGTIEEPLAATSTAGTVVIPCNGIEAPPAIWLQPASTSQVENTMAVFFATVTNSAQVFYQWFTNGSPAAGATTAGFTVTNITPAMEGMTFRCVISNSLGVVTSATATLSVLADTNPPTVMRAYNVGLTNVLVSLSEAISTATLTNPANYAITNGGISILAAMASTNGTLVTLATTPLTIGSNYWIRINNLSDLAGVPNTLATNTTTSFVALDYAPADIGFPPPANSTVLDMTSDGLTIRAAGSQINGTSDQFSLYWQQKTGDFDIMVRLASISLADAWSKAGLMARADLGASSTFAASFATPSIAGCYFQSRATNGTSATMLGSAPVNYPNTWLRLQRATNTFYGYASMDGANWLQMGIVAITSMPATCYLGLAVSSHQTNSVTTTAQFREIADATGQSLGSYVQDFEPLGASTRRTGLTFSEIMYHPTDRPDGKNLEFIEIFNSQSIAEEIGGFRLSGDIDYTFPPGTVLKAGGFAVVARVPADVQSVYGIADVFGPYTNGLPNNGGTVRLRSELNALLLEVNYDDAKPWPVAADGTGHSLVLAHASYGENYARAWTISDAFGGTPGTWNTVSNDPLDGVVINEFLAHTDLPLVDYLELYNHNNTARDISGCWLSDKPGTNIYRIPNGTVIAARGFMLFDETALGFRLDSTGGQLLLVNSNNTRVLDAVDFEAQQNSVSSGRMPDGGAEIYQLASRTPAAANGPRKIQDIVINELMYSPISGSADDQYVEIFNRASSNVDLSAWRFVSGIDFTFPTNTTIPSQGYIVVAKNFTNLLAKYPQLSATNCIGNFSGQLSGRGERIALGYPDYNLQTDGTVIVSSMIVSEVTYKDGGRWGTWSDGGGCSMELVNPDADTRLPTSWADSDESGKTAAWTTIEYTGPLMETVYSPNNDQLHVYLLGVGECLVDDIELLTNGISVVVTNAGFEAGKGPWTFLGAYDQSSVDTGGYSGTQCLHVRGSARGDPGANRIQSATFPPLPANFSNVTLRCKARWLRGWPELMLRMHGGSIEATGALAPPPDLGTPGMVNSVYVSNEPPSISTSPAHPSSLRSARLLLLLLRRTTPTDLAHLHCDIELILRRPSPTSA